VTCCATKDWRREASRCSVRASSDGPTKVGRTGPRESVSPPANWVLRKAIRWNGTPEKITIDEGGANTAAIESHNAETEASVEIRQIKYLNNIVEQDHRAIKRLARPMLGFKSFRSAAVTLTGIELMRMIRKGQLLPTGEMCPARQFCSLAG
jgi:putative transposase